MIRDSTIVILILIGLISLLTMFLLEANAELVYYEKITVKGFNIHLFVVDDIKDMPCGNLGCAIYGYLDGEKFDAIFLMDKYLNVRDQYGYSALYNELKHIFCQCDWHEGLRWV